MEKEANTSAILFLYSRINISKMKLVLSRDKIDRGKHKSILKTVKVDNLS